MNKSIFGMNRTVGERELKQTAADLTPEQLHDVAINYSLDFWVRLSRKRKSAKQQVESLRNILKIADTDPSHRRTAEVVLPPAKMTTLQQLADDQAASFNRRYYNNPDGKAEFKY